MTRPGTGHSTAQTEPLLEPLKVTDEQNRRARLYVCDRLPDVDTRRAALEALGLIEGPPTPDPAARRRTAARAARRRVQAARERAERDEAS